MIAILVDCWQPKGGRAASVACCPCYLLYGLPSPKGVMEFPFSPLPLSLWPATVLPVLPACCCSCLPRWYGKLHETYSIRVSLMRVDFSWATPHITPSRPRYVDINEQEEILSNNFSCLSFLTSPITFWAFDPTKLGESKTYVLV